MDAARSLDGHLGAAVDDLLSLAALAASASSGRPAVAASAALDPLIAFLDAGAPDAPGDDPSPDLAGERAHAQH